MAPPLSFTAVLHSTLLLFATTTNADPISAPYHLIRSFTTPLNIFRSFTPSRDGLVSRAPIVLPSGWIARACVREPSTGRTLTGYSFTSSSMTATSCVAQCDSRGFRYAGAEFGSECYCGDSFEGGATGGGTIASGECNMSCAGDATQTCGDGNRLTTYERRSNTTVAPVLPTGWNYTGCITEPSSGRTLANYSFVDGTMTIDKCVATCNSRGFHIAGAEYSNECWCGDSFQGTALGGGVAVPPSECNMPCAGESTQTCGAGYRLSAYSYTQPNTPPSGPTLPTGWAYVSCMQEPSGGRLLGGYSFTNNGLTVESCVSTCQRRGFIYAGMEFANECHCATGYTSPPVTASESDCSMPCAGNSSQKCGAGFRLNVYSSESQSSGTTGLILPPFWPKSSQCIVEASTGRTLSGTAWTDDGMTVEKCVSFCDNTGFKYAGVEYGKECYCDNSVSTANGGGVLASSSSQCDKPCAGNPQQICGAGFRISLYSKSTSNAAALPAGWSPSMCAIDNDSRVLVGFQTTDTALTPSSCINKCASMNYNLAGVENGQECYCSNSLTNNPIGAREDQCNIPCAGDSSLNCGGGWRVMVYQRNAAAPSGQNAWSLTAGGTSGIVMTHVAVVNNETIVVIDRKENNPLKNAQNSAAWGAVWSLVSNTVRALNIATHSFCSAGGFLSNGTFVNFGGHPYTNRDNEAAPDGQQGIRLFNACPASGNCDIYENADRIRMGDTRWYPTSARLPDGSAIILGGSKVSDWTNRPTINSPTYEFYPVKNVSGSNGLPVQSPFFVDTLPHNLYPLVYALPDGSIFVAANNKAMLLDWHTNTETRLPNFPNGQRVVYPFNAAGVLLPLTPENNYTPEMVICGGSQISDQIESQNLDAQRDYGSAQCSRMVLNAAGIAGGWQTEWMPEPRLMSEGVLLPDGKILIINGCRTGAAGYGNLKNRVGDSNADNPTLTPLLYDPSAPVGQRITRDGLPTSNIPRMYHSVATLLPSGAIMIGGSNPNDDFSAAKYASELRVEYMYPSYMTKPRPTFSGLATSIGYNTTFTLSVTLPAGAQNVYAIIMDYGFVTHSVHMDQKLVKLVSVRQGNTLVVTGPPSAFVYSPGPAWVMVVADGVPSVAQQVMVGNGAGPPVDQAAIAYMLASTQNPDPGPH